MKVTADGDVAYEQTITVRGNWAPNERRPCTRRRTTDIHPRVGQPASFVIQGYDPEEAPLADDLHGQMGRRDHEDDTPTRRSSTCPLVHTYATPGTYTIHYSATDQDGSVTYPAQTTWGTPFRVRAANNPPPRYVSYFTDIGSAGGGRHGDVHGDGLGSRRRRHRLLRVELRRRNAAADIRRRTRATHAFTQPGTYAVRLTETDDGGASTTYEYTYTV